MYSNKKYSSTHIFNTARKGNTLISPGSWWELGQPHRDVELGRRWGSAGSHSTCTAHSSTAPVLGSMCLSQVMPASAIILLCFTDGARADWGCNHARSGPAWANIAAKPQDAFPPLQHFSLAKLVPGLQDYFPLSPFLSLQHSCVEAYHSEPILQRFIHLN